jgi:transposase InsO family protein
MSLMTDQGKHFMNKTIKTLTQKIMVECHFNNPYQPQENGVVEAFNKIWECGLKSVCDINYDDWDEKIPSIL